MKTSETTPSKTSGANERSDHQLRVDDFMKQAGQDVPTQPGIPSRDIRLLRARLIFEEAMETIQALGFTAYNEVDRPDFYRKQPITEFDQLPFEDTDPDLILIVDGCCDIKVVTTGTLSACGVADEGPQRLVDKSNLEKFGEGGYRREDGKWVKPPSWRPPDLAGELLRQWGPSAND